MIASAVCDDDHKKALLAAPPPVGGDGGVREQLADGIAARVAKDTGQRQ